MAYTKKITVMGGKFYLAYARFLQEIGFIEEFGSIKNRTYEAMLKNTPPYRDGKKGGSLERGKFYMGMGGDDTSLPTPTLYYSVPLREDENPFDSSDIGLIGFNLATIEDMRDKGYDFESMEIDDFDDARESANSSGEYWETSYMNNKGIWGMFTPNSWEDYRGVIKDFYGHKGYKFWEIPEEDPKLGVFNWWW